jgi:hypothetical protein
MINIFILPPEVVDLLRDLTTAGKVQNVPFDVRLKVVYRLPNLVTTPNGWAVSDEPWALTDIGRRAMGAHQ